ncbi:hypothetical protein BGW38_003960 [Lunasporangiospora selenospora]|uniref:N-acetyltransferase domain-containing protein n=1 Tax=Lunasporangiospora selenospora TaxID=979761 RepID=A0A9P6KBV1_9FUNG|nr:hypothetical protein BGW38_003960 [Lunasporangiospora selenospora]
MTIISKKIKYTKRDPSEYTQRTLGEGNGYAIETDLILLEPILLERDVPKLWEVYKDHPELFAFMPHGPCLTYESFYAVQAGFCSNPGFFNWAVYLLIDNGKAEKTKILCGSICLLDIVLQFRRFEVGSIWFHPSVHSTFVMVETTYALLRFSFEILEAGRVQWKTHHKNIASQKAAARLGFDLDGIHRKHMIHCDGTWRNTYFYSMTDDDWFGFETVSTSAEKMPVESRRPEFALGRQLQLEKTVETRREEGRPLPESVQQGVALA